MSQPKTKTSAPKAAPKRAASVPALDKRLNSLFGGRELTPEQHIAAAAASEMRWIDYTDLEDNPFQMRESYDEGDTHDMVESLNSVGQIQAGVCRPHPDPTKPGKFQIAVGHRRTRSVAAGGNAGTGRENAHLYIGKVWMRVAKLSDMEMRVFVNRENTDRVDANAMELANSYSNIRTALADGGKLTWADVSKMTGLGIRQMRRYADLLDLPKAAQDKIRDGIWNERHGRALLSFEKDDPRQAILMRNIEKEGLSGAAAEKRAGTLRSVHATQREMDIAEGAQKSHETVVAHNAAQAREENRAALETGQSHLTLVPPVETPSANEEDGLIAKPVGYPDETHQAGVLPPLVSLTPEAGPPDIARVADPLAELLYMGERLNLISVDIATTAVITPDFEGQIRDALDGLQSGANSIILALGDSHAT